MNKKILTMLVFAIGIIALFASDDTSENWQLNFAISKSIAIGCFIALAKVSYFKLKP